MSSFTLRSISKAAIPAAVKKAEHYRLLNDPEQAESICLDILAVDPDNQQALVVLILAITDQFGRSDGPLGPRARSSTCSGSTTRTTATTTRA